MEDILSDARASRNSKTGPYRERGGERVMVDIALLFNALNMVRDAVENGPDYVAFRSQALTYKGDGFIIDTCCPSDTNKWETGILSWKITGSEKWVIVEQYENEISAKKGHGEWVNRLSADPKMGLHDIDLWGLDDER